jgi:two-component system sensor histidine kinase QseC
MRSLRDRVTVYVLLAIGAVLVPIGIVSYRNIMAEFDALADARLVQATRTIDVLAENAGLRNPQPAAPLDVMVWRSPFEGSTLVGGGHPYEARLGFQYWNANDRLQVTSDNFEGVSLAATRPGFSDLMVQGNLWRVFTLRETDNDTVRVAERYDSRNSIARALLFEHVTPVVIAVPMLTLLVGWAVRRALRPLDTLSRSLSTRQIEDTAAIQMAQTPRELEPVMKSLNGLLDRVHATLERERQFTADAAHQLRTPLTGALLHVENAMASDDAESRQLALERAHEGLGRLQRLVSQFLELARWDAKDHEFMGELVDLEACVRTEIEDAALLAADKNLELTVTIENPGIRLLGWEPALRALVRNLIENAFRYTPAGGQVEARLSKNAPGVLLEVSDSGPGIPVDQRVAVLQRFRRGSTADVDGHGLGLPIVCRIAELHGATVELRESRYGRGLCVAVNFPARASLLAPRTADSVS